MIDNISGINTKNILDLNSVKKNNIESESFKENLNNAIQKGDEKDLKEACLQFESYFLNMMFKSMRKTVISGEGIFKKSNAENIFQEMLDQEMTKKMANQGGIGLADMMYKQLSRDDNKMDINV